MSRTNFPKDFVEESSFDSCKPIVFDSDLTDEIKTKLFVTSQHYSFNDKATNKIFSGIQHEINPPPETLTLSFNHAFETVSKKGDEKHLIGIKRPSVSHLHGKAANKNFSRIQLEIKPPPKTFTLSFNHAFETVSKKGDEKHLIGIKRPSVSHLHGICPIFKTPEKYIKFSFYESMNPHSPPKISMINEERKQILSNKFGNVDISIMDSHNNRFKRRITNDVKGCYLPFFPKIDSPPLNRKCNSAHKKHKRNGTFCLKPRPLLFKLE